MRKGKLEWFGEPEEQYDFTESLEEADKTPAYYAAHPEKLGDVFEPYSTKNQKTVEYLINKYGPNLTLQEVLQRYEDEKEEDLDKTWYDGYGWRYDYENRPLKITDIKYLVWLTKEEVEELKWNMKRTDDSTLYVVPYYDEKGYVEETNYLGLINTKYLTRHILDSDYRYDSSEWGYKDGLFQFVPWFTDMDRLTYGLYKRLGIEEPPYIGEDIARRGEIVDIVCRDYKKVEDRMEPAAKMMKDHMDNMRKKFWH